MSGAKSDHMTSLKTMAASDGAFAAAVRRVLELHQTQVEELKMRLQEQCRLDELQRTRIRELEEQLNKLRHVASRAKAKIEAQQRRNRMLHQLLKRADPHLALTVDRAAESALSAEELDVSRDPEDSLAEQRTSHLLHSANRTAITLFSESPASTFTTSVNDTPAHHLVPTPLSVEQSSNITTEVTVEDQSDDTSTSASSDSSDVILVDVTQFYPNPAAVRAQAAHNVHIPGTGSISSRNGELVSAYRVRMDDDEVCIPGESSDESAESGSSSGPDTEQEEDVYGMGVGSDTVAQGSTGSQAQNQHCGMKNLPKSKSYLHAHGNRALSLRDRASKVRYRELHTNVDQSTAVSVVAGKTGTSPARGVSGDRIDDTCSPSLLAKTPEPDRNDSSRSCSTSPSLLRSSGSPWKQPQSPVSMVVPNPSKAAVLASSTPAFVIGNSSLQLKTPNESGFVLQIPETDSQLSLDVSQTMPLSPELCFPSSRRVPSASDLHDQEVVVTDGRALMHHPVPSVSGVNAAKKKPPLPEPSASKRHTLKRSKKRTQHLKQATLTQTLHNISEDSDQQMDQTTNLGATPSPSVEPGIAQATTPNVILATPGVKPVSNILGGGRMHLPLWSSNLGSHQTLPTGRISGSKRPVNGNREEGNFDDSEDVLPRKRPHLAVLYKQEQGGSSKDTPGGSELSQLSVQYETEVGYTEPKDEEEDVDITRLVGDMTTGNGTSVEILEDSPEYNPPSNQLSVTTTGPRALSIKSFVKTDTGHQNVPNVNIPQSTASESAHGDAQGGEQKGEQPQDLNEDAKALAARAGLPTYKCVVPIRKRADRDKLDAKPCPECQAWYSGDDGIHRDQRGHLKHTCRHKDLYLPPNTDPKMWEISFPSTEECEDMWGEKHAPV